MSNADVYHFSNEEFNVSMSADINAEALVSENPNLYDYVLTLDTNMNNLFSTKSFSEDPNNKNEAIVDLALNSSAFNAAMNNVRIHSNSDAEVTGLIPAKSTVDLRYMEMIACKLFGNATARAAIRNDTLLLEPLTGDLLTHVTDLVSSRKEDIFQAYFASSRASSVDFTSGNSSNFNFTGQTLSFPAWLNGAVANPDDLDDAILNRNTGGISNVNNGNYAIKVLIRVGDQDASGVSV
jgi:hypothetical protein